LLSFRLSHSQTSIISTSTSTSASNSSKPNLPPTFQVPFHTSLSPSSSLQLDTHFSLGPWLGFRFSTFRRPIPRFTPFFGVRRSPISSTSITPPELDHHSLQSRVSQLSSISNTQPRFPGPFFTQARPVAGSLARQVPLERNRVTVR
jgi:hypothetical protein